MISLVLIGLGILVVIAIIVSIAWYRIVDPSEAHLVAGPRSKFVASADDKIGSTRWYMAIPSWIPFFGRAIRLMDLTIKEIIIKQETIEKDQARYSVQSSTKYRIVKVKIAAETSVDEKDLAKQLEEVICAGIRATTIKYSVVDARAKKKEIELAIREEITDDLGKWGLELINFQLVKFSDTDDSSIISDISKRREVAIESETRQLNAEKLKQARIKEAESEEKSRQREIEKDKSIGEYEQEKKKSIATAEKLAREEELEVTKVEQVKNANIQKEKAKVVANQEKEVQEILKEKLKLEGEGERLKLEEMAKGNAAKTREQGFAEAEAKDKLQDALNKFTPGAIQALVAEQVVAMQQAVGIETAKALKEADMKVFAGDGDGKSGFDLGKLISAASVSNEGTADAVLNKLARPNDLGLSVLGIKSLQEPNDKKDSKESNNSNKNRSRKQQRNNVKDEKAQ